MGDDQHDVLPRHADPFLQRADGIGEVLDHVRGEDEVEGVVGEGEVVPGSNDVHPPLAAGEPPFLLLVDRVHLAEAIDVERVETVVVLRGAADLDPAQPGEVVVDEGRPVLGTVPEDPAGENRVLGRPVADRFS